MANDCCAFTGPIAMPAVQRSVFLFIASVLAALLTLAPPSAGASLESTTLNLYVDAGARSGGTGTEARPFKNLPEAVTAARRQSSSYSRIFITVRAGSYRIGSPIRVDFPVEIRGSNIPDKDRQNWPLGTAQTGSETRLYAGECVGTLLSVGREDGEVISNVSIRNLTLIGDSTGCASDESLLQIQHTQYVVIVDNIVTGPAGSGVDVAASSGLVARNFVAGMGNCGICISAGTAASPTELSAVDNRAREDFAGGLLINGTAFPLAEEGELLDVNVLHNDLSDNAANPKLGFGVRFIAIGPNLPLSQESGQATARIYENRIANNNLGVMIDAGFPNRVAAGVCDEREYTARIDLAFRSNTVIDNFLSPALIAFTRGQVVTAGQSLSNWQYLHNATFVIDDSDRSLQPFELNHPMDDPWLGPCPGDGTNEPLMNSLNYNGTLVPENL